MAWLRDALTAAGTAQARLEVEASRAAFRDWRRALIVLALVLPVFVVPVAFGASIPDTIGGKQRYGPSDYSSDLIIATMLVGLAAGLIAGSIGAGGGFIVTPALMTLGVRGILAVGTGMLYLFANGLVGTVIHRKLGNINVKLAAAFTIGSISGVTLGGVPSRALYEANPIASDLVISLMYVVILGFLGFYSIGDVLGSRTGGEAGSLSRDGGEARSTAFVRVTRSIRLPPMIAYDEGIDGGKQISAPVVVAVGLVVGLVTAILGVGGGFITFPVFVYGLGISTLTTTGTNTLQVVITSGFGSIGQYAVHGYVIYSLAIAMMLGSLVGVQIGALSTRGVSPALIRAFYATAILAGFVNRLFAVPEDLARLGVVQLHPDVGQGIATVGTVLFFALVALLALWVVGAFVRALPRLRARSASPVSPAAPRGLVRQPRALALAIALLVGFYATIAALALPLLPKGQSGLAWADSLFNAVSKSESWFLADETRAVDELGSRPVDVTLRAPDEAQAALWADLYRSAGANAEVQATDVRVTGDLRQILSGALSDAELVYSGRDDAVASRHTAEPRAVTYGWWSSLKQVERHLDADRRHKESGVVRSVSRRVLEPAHNYYGTDGRSLEANAWLIAGVLGAYLLFTAWYGSAIYALAAAFGLTGGRRKEAPDSQATAPLAPTR